MDIIDILGNGTIIFANLPEELQELIGDLIIHGYIFLVNSERLSVEIMGKDGKLFDD